MLSVAGGDTDLLASASAAWTRPFPPWVPRAFSSHGWGSPQLFTPQSWVPTAMCWRCSAVCMLPSPTSRRENELRGPGTPHPARPSLWWPRAGHLSPACAPAWPCRARDKRTFGAAALPTRAEASAGSLWPGASPVESACWGASLSAPCLSPRLPRAVSVRAAGRGAICSGLGERLAAAGSSWRNAGLFHGLSVLPLAGSQVLLKAPPASHPWFKAPSPAGLGAAGIVVGASHL